VPLRAFGIRDAHSRRLVSFAAFIPQPGSQWNEKWDAFMERHAAACARLEFCDGAAVHARLVECDKHWGAEPMDEEYWYLLLLVTDPAHHGRGLGRALVAHGKRFAKGAGCGVDLEASHADLGVPFYASQRFQVASRWQAPHAANCELLHACGCGDASACEHCECSAHLAPVCHYMQVTREQLRADSTVEPLPAAE
jgi:GNAT superfamily N-acetyltransferase